MIPARGASHFWVLVLKGKGGGRTRLEIEKMLKLIPRVANRYFTSISTTRYAVIVNTGIKQLIIGANCVSRPLIFLLRKPCQKFVIMIGTTTIARTTCGEKKLTSIAILIIGRPTPEIPFTMPPKNNDPDIISSKLRS